MTYKTPPPIPKANRASVKRVIPEMSLDKALKLLGKCGPLSIEKYGVSNVNSDTDVLIILPRASRELKDIIYWGERHPINHDEQLYQGMGHFFLDKGRRIIVVSHIMYIYAAERTPVSAHINGGNTISIMPRIEYERAVYNKNERTFNITPDKYAYDPFIEEGGLSVANLHGHTHPDIGCFFSQPDRTSGFATPDYPAVTFVADPIRMDMKAGVGIELKDAEIIVCNYKTECDNKKSVSSAQKESIKVNIPDENAGMQNGLKIRGPQFVKPDELISEISRDCSELLNPVYGAKGKFISHTTVTGVQKIKMEMKWKPEKQVVKKSSKDISTVGKTYDSYA